MTQLHPQAARGCALQAKLFAKMHQPDCPQKFRAIARWWRLSSIESADREPQMKTADAQLWIAADMEARPRHHALKPLDMTRYQWAQRK